MAFWLHHNCDAVETHMYVVVRILEFHLLSNTLT